MGLVLISFFNSRCFINRKSWEVFSMYLLWVFLQTLSLSIEYSFGLSLKWVFQYIKFNLVLSLCMLEIVFRLWLARMRFHLGLAMVLYWRSRQGCRLEFQKNCIRDKSSSVLGCLWSHISRVLFMFVRAPLLEVVEKQCYPLIYQLLLTKYLGSNYSLEELERNQWVSWVLNLKGMPSCLYELYIQAKTKIYSLL